MADFDRKKFKEYWLKTEIIRQYQRMLYTFGDIELPYVFVAKHDKFDDRAVVRRGTVLMQRPRILLPGSGGGPQFKEGFEHARAIPPDVAYIFRAARVPYSTISNRPVAREHLEYGRPTDILDKINSQLDRKEDTDTGLIQGLLEGMDISLMRYSFGLAVKSAPENMSEFLEHLRKRKGRPIRPDEKITDDEIRRLFD